MSKRFIFVDFLTKKLVVIVSSSIMTITEKTSDSNMDSLVFSHYFASFAFEIAIS